MRIGPSAGSSAARARSEGGIHGLWLAALAISGLVAGHTVAYIVTVRDAQARLSLLARTGHSYWHAAMAIAVVGGLTAVVARIARSFSAGRHDGRAPSQAGLFLRLAPMQLVGFVLMETTERLAAHQSPSTVFAHHFLVIGLLAQVVVALLVTAVDRLLSHAAHALGVALASTATLHPPTDTVRAWYGVVVPRVSAGAGGGSRAPPVLVV
jgi:hypothetical protein